MSDSNAPYPPAEASATDERPTYAAEAITGESGYGAGETGSINRGSERSGVTTGVATDANEGDDAANPEAAGQALANSGAGTRYAEANATAGELINSNTGYATGYAGSSGADESRRFRTSSDPEYGERDMGYGDDAENP